MSLELLLDKNITNFIELQPVESKQDDPILKQYRNLQGTKHFDNKNQLWRYTLEKESAMSPDFRSTEQLIGIWVESLFNKDNAYTIYNEKLKQTELYDQTKQQWNGWVNEDLCLSNCARYSKDQLLGILVEAIFDKKNALIQYQKLKKTALLSIFTNQWIVGIKKNGRKLNTERRNSDQLLGILVDAAFDINKAGKKYKKLKNYLLFDSKNQHWTGSINVFQPLLSPSYSIDSQLLAVLVEAIFDKKNAIAQYSSLKEQFFDKKCNLWARHLLTDTNVINAYTSHQLYGILAEKTLGISSQVLIQKTFVPTVRRF